MASDGPTLHFCCFPRSPIGESSRCFSDARLQEAEQMNPRSPWPAHPPSVTHLSACVSSRLPKCEMPRKGCLQTLPLIKTTPVGLLRGGRLWLAVDEGHSRAWQLQGWEVIERKAVHLPINDPFAVQEEKTHSDLGCIEPASQEGRVMERPAGATSAPGIISPQREREMAEILTSTHPSALAWQW